TKPETPFLRCVSVDTVTGRVVLNWNQSPSQDVQGYQVVRFDNGLNTIVADTNSPTATNIRDTTSGAQANDRFLLYSVVAYDDCEDPNTNLFNTSTTDQVIQTLFIEDPEVDICTRSITLNWNGAIGDTLVAVTDLAGFEIYASANFGPPVLVHSADSGDTAFVHEDLTFGVKYRYYMMALEKNSGKKALSNAVIGVMIPPNRPDTHYLNLVTVNPLDNVIEVSCLVDTSADVSRYGLLRSIRPNGPFQMVSTLTNSRKDRVITFRDLTAEADQLSYYYRVSVIDLCGATVLESNTSRSIYLQGTSNTINLVNELEWNPYSDWDTLGNGVARYNLYRVINGVIGTSPVAIDVANFRYQDDFTDVRASDGNVCYVAEAVEAAGNAFGFQGISRSNVQCFPQQPQLFIPNAFSPNFDG
ncbi:MAG: hypothetical protein AAGB22_13555, partial [Bacteroidota bacterium]